MAKLKVQTISELHEFLRENMVTKTELDKGLEQQEKKADKSFHELYHFLQKNMATKNDVGVVATRIDNIERNFVHKDEFAGFKNGVYNKFDTVMGKLDELGTEDKMRESGLSRVEDNMENHDKRIKANRQDIDKIKFSLKTA